ncbi:hypothetical protein RMCBS344292_05780 [Rhizopus microsporus]|nr:hypothetical protein RMCBS344292_05780 [Rhizopus microsporus]
MIKAGPIVSVEDLYQKHKVDIKKSGVLAKKSCILWRKPPPISMQLVDSDEYPKFRDIVKVWAW